MFRDDAYRAIENFWRISTGIESAMRASHEQVDNEDSANDGQDNVDTISAAVPNAVADGVVDDGSAAAEPLTPIGGGSHRVVRQLVRSQSEPAAAGDPSEPPPVCIPAQPSAVALATAGTESVESEVPPPEPSEDATTASEMVLANDMDAFSTVCGTPARVADRPML